MNVLLISDRKSMDRKELMNTLESTLKKDGHIIETVIVNRDKIKPCMGCFGCWMKTPGKCVITTDATNAIVERAVNSDVILIVTEITYGGFSSDSKAFVDRLIPVLQPFFKMHKGEMHHSPRYSKRPSWIYIGCGDVGEEEKKTFFKFVNRNTLNTQPPGYMIVRVQNEDKFAEKANDILIALTQFTKHGRRMVRGIDG